MIDIIDGFCDQTKDAFIGKISNTCFTGRPFFNKPRFSPKTGEDLYVIWSPLKTSCERKCAVRAIFVVKPPRKAYSLTSSTFLEAGTPCPFLLFTSVFRGSNMVYNRSLTMTAFIVLAQDLKDSAF